MSSVEVSLRDKFASIAFRELLKIELLKHHDSRQIAESAYRYADEMIRMRKIV